MPHEFFSSLLTTLLNPLTLIETAGLIGVFAIVFAESGLFFGFFLPGDSLLFTAGILASQTASGVPAGTHFFNIWLLIIGAVIAAIAGDSVGYWFGAITGPRIFTKEDSFFFKRRYVIRTQEFYAKYGARTIILARFVPIVRTFTPIMAGVGKMNYHRFLAYNIIGGAGWAALLASLGYFLGNSVPNIDHYILPIVAIIILISIAPIPIGYFRERTRKIPKNPTK